MLSSLAALAGLTLMPALNGLNQAEAKSKGQGHSARGDNGKHLGWTKGKHKGWSKSSQTWDRDDRDDRRYDRSTSRRSTRRSSTRDQWTRRTPTTRRNTSTWRRTNERQSSWLRPTSDWSLRSTRPFSTRQSANRAAALRRQQGYRTAVSYDANRRAYVLREYSRR
jgi:hypothetical protein